MPPETTCYIPFGRCQAVNLNLMGKTSNTNLRSKREKRLMKLREKRFVIALGVASGLIVATSAQAQIWTLSDFHNFNLSATYANWNVDGSQPINGGSGFTPVITSGPTSYEIQAQQYGSGAYNFPTPLNASGADTFHLTFTINQTMHH